MFDADDDSPENVKVICQVPHHGAKNEWEKMSDSIKDKIKTVIISYGNKNTYHHPNGIVVLDLYNARKKIKNVTQGKSFNYFI